MKVLLLMAVCACSWSSTLSEDDQCGGPEWKYDVQSGKCYQVFTDHNTRHWPKAMRTCRALGSELPVLQSQEENEALEDFITANWNNTDEVWIGLSSPSKNCKAFEWTNGAPLNYTNWVQGYDVAPYHCADRFSQWCVMMDLDIDATRSWLLSYCLEKRPFICVKKSRIGDEVHDAMS
ncbi:type-2 ice-structuring protein-like protein [Aphelenchoides avenae]|nr:type-2 ice-structuring protein-like protein [Aphelenchus avenae]